MNKVILIGRLGGEPEIRYGETQVARFSLAVDRKKGETDFFNLVAFGKTAEFVEKYLKKGTKVATVGRLQNDLYTNKDGKKVTQTKVIAEEIEFCEKKAEEPRYAVPEKDTETLPFNF